MSAIDAAIPEAGKHDDAKLARIDADALARYVIDQTHPWWRRRPCALALRGRVPSARISALFDRIQDPNDVSEIRIALLDVLGDRIELLPWLKTQGPDQRYGVYEQILMVRARLGDLSAAGELSTIASSLWGHRSRLGRAALDLLVERHGRTTVEQRLGVDRPEDRAFANRMRARDHADLTPALADGDLGVAREAAELMIGLGVPDDEHLLDHVVTGPTIEARLFAAYVLHRRGRDVRELWAALDRPRVDVPGLADDVRRAVVRTYPGEAHCDPRWLLEQVCADLGPAPDVEAQLARAVEALTRADLAPGKPQSGEAAQGTGESTYHQIETSRGVVLVSTLGPFAIGGHQATMPPHALVALEQAGFRWIENEEAAVIVSGLPVYYFGDRDPLDVRTLLFYWQD